MQGRQESRHVIGDSLERAWGILRMFPRDELIGHIPQSILDVYYEPRGIGLFSPPPQPQPIDMEQVGKEQRDEKDPVILKATTKILD